MSRVRLGCGKLLAGSFGLGEWFCLDQSQRETGEPVHRLAVRSRYEVAVDIGSQLDRGMPELLAHVLQGLPILDQ